MMPGNSLERAKFSHSAHFGEMGWPLEWDFPCLQDQNFVCYPTPTYHYCFLLFLFLFLFFFILQQTHFLSTGHFSPAQSTLYEAVLEVQRSCIILCQHHDMTMDELFREMLTLIGLQLRRLGIVSKRSSAMDLQVVSLLKRLVTDHQYIHTMTPCQLWSEAIQIGLGSNTQNQQVLRCFSFYRVWNYFPMVAQRTSTSRKLLVLSNFH